MRIISGEFKGRRAITGKKFNARPTTDFAKESLFNILNNYFYFEKLRVLDLFAGTGSISMEFASRGCEKIELVENDPKNYRLLCNTLRAMAFTSIKPIKADAFKYIEKCVAGYDIIFADPPYDIAGTETIPDIVFTRHLLNDEGWLVVEHSKKLDFSKHAHFKEVRNYGAVHFSIFVQ